MTRTMSRGLRAGLRAIALGLVMAAGVPGAPEAQQSTIVVGNDRGGYIGARAAEIRRILRQGARVEIRGNICYSSCTMYLGAGNVCVSPATSFGFHGPSRHGTPLPPDEFEHFSNVMARFYSPALRRWFMSEARYTIGEPYRLSGAQLISLGYRSC